jgi:biotin carboxyl carrier protein
MKKFKFTIQGNQYDVEILNIEDDVAEIEVNGTKYQVEIEKETKTSKTPRLVRSKSVPSTEDTQAKTSKPTASKGTGHIKAPLPGTILEINVKPGDPVKTGDQILIMEAMKMENVIKSDREGKVESIKVNSGDNVLEGDILVEIGSN